LYLVDGASHTWIWTGSLHWYRSVPRGKRGESRGEIEIEVGKEEERDTHLKTPVR
jgi:hypothetical protein